MTKLKIIILSSILTFTIIISYCSVIIIDAKNYTDTIVKTDMKNGVWRIIGKNPRKLELNINDFSESQLRALIAVQDPAFYEHNGVDLLTPGAGITTISQAITKKLYFEKSLNMLSENEYLSLIAILIGPNTFDIIKHPVRNKERVDRIKSLIAGNYAPKGLMDLYYGDIAIDTDDLATFSKF